MSARCRSLAGLATLGVALASLASAERTIAADLPRLPADVFAPSPSPMRLPDDVFAQPDDDGAVNLVLFSRTRAAVVRLDVNIGGVPYRRSFREFLRALHVYLDRDDDGIVTETEATSVPWMSILANPIFGGATRTPAAGRALHALDWAPKDGVVTLEELETYIRDIQTIRPLTAQVGNPPDARAEAFFGQLDEDDDHRVAPADGERLLARLDADEDEFVSLDELTPDRIPSGRRTFFAAGANNTAANPAKDAAVVLASDDMPAFVAARLRNSFGKDVPGPSGKSRKVLPLSALIAAPGAVELADQDRDGFLDQAELESFLTYPRPAAILSLNLPRPGAPAAPSATIMSIVSPAADRPLQVRHAADGTKSFVLDDLEFIVRTGESNQNFDDFMRQQFDQADTNKDGRIDAKEARANNIFQRVTLVVDRSRDGIVTRAEYDRYLDLSRDSAQSRAVASVGGGGSGLFARVDANNDGRLSPRELRAAAAKLAPLDRNRDGRLDLDELPRRYELTIGRGQNVNRQVFVTQFVETRSTPAQVEGIVPLWFQGMDRNGDGDVSPREFIGPVDAFRRLDADHDGLIDAREAQQLR